MKQKLKNTKPGQYWLTHFEKSRQQQSPSYDETISYFMKFENKTPYAKMLTLGLSLQGREIKCMVVSSNNEFTAEDAKKSGKAIVLIQNGIHAGEIEGKDACMLLLRDMLVTKEKFHLLKKLILLIIPIFNVDGHERVSAYNRPNQNGPQNMGWRTTAQNLNLNRDYMKADSPEMKVWLKFFTEWLPDFIIDNHTTNGADYQYHLTYGIERKENISPHLSKWINNKYLPHIITNVEKDGFLITRYIEFKGEKLTDGLIDYPMLPRFSTGYCAVQNRISLLVETHSLKPFSNRVFSTKSIIEHTLNFINKNSREIIALNKKADSDTINFFCKKGKVLPVDFEGTPDNDIASFKGYESYEEMSEITGTNVIRYSNKPAEFDVPLFNKTRIKIAVSVPKAYLIPQQFSNIIEILSLHGIEYKTLNKPQSLLVEKYNFINESFADRPYEGRQQARFGLNKAYEKITAPKGTFIVPTNQRTLRVIVNLLEPIAPDSFVSWGFFNAFFERKEYAEAYIMEPIAKEMMKKDSKLSKLFYEKLECDEAFRNNPAERLEFFYKQSVYFDKCEKIYPIMRTDELIA